MNLRKVTICNLEIVILVSFIAFTSVATGDNGDSGEIFGFVKDIRGRPIENIVVELIDENGNYVSNIQTNVTGSFVLSNVTPGNYSIIVYYEHEKIYQENITFQGNESLRHDIIIPLQKDDPDDTGAGAISADDDSSCLLVIIIPLVTLVLLIILSLAIFSRIRRSHILNHETRDRICSHIRENPGAHFTAIKKDLGLSTGVLSYHMERLERENFVISRAEGKYKRFYPPRWDQPPAIHLSQIQEIILEQIKRRPGISQSDLGSSIGRNRKVINYQAHQLRELGLIEIEKEGRESRCYFVRDA